MSRKLEKAVQRWKDAGPLDERAEQLLLEVKEANARDQSDDLIWAAFVRSLSEEQQVALKNLIDLIGKDSLFNQSR